MSKTEFNMRLALMAIFGVIATAGLIILVDWLVAEWDGARPGIRPIASPAGKP